MPEERSFCTFLIDGGCFGVDVSKVQEVVRHHRVSRVPLAPDVVAGLINLRGQLITAIDLRRRLGLPDAAAGESQMNVVLRTEEGVVSFLVDQIGDVLEVEQEAFERPPETLQGAARELIRGTYKLPDRLLLILDVERAVRPPKQGDAQ